MSPAVGDMGYQDPNLRNLYEKRESPTLVTASAP